MDTDDLSRELYKAVISEAESFHHDLTIQFGLLADECKSELEYEAAATDLANELKKATAEDLDDIFFGEPVDRKRFLAAIDKILENLQRIKKIPLNKRTFETY